MERHELIAANTTGVKSPKRALKEALSKVPTNLRDTIKGAQFKEDQSFGFQDHAATDEATTLARLQLAYFAEDPEYAGLIKQMYSKRNQPIPEAQKN